MESTKVPIMFQNNQKLKQATLSFETMNINSDSNSPPVKRQKLNDYSMNEAVEVTNETFTENDIKTYEENSSDIEIIAEVITQTISSVCAQEKAENETEKIRQKESESSNIVETDKNIEIHLNSSVNKSDYRNVKEDNLKTSKRKLESNENSVEQKKPKRVKLIYHVDKLKKSLDTNSETSVNALNEMHMNSYKLGQTESKVEENTKTSFVVSKSQADGTVHDVQEIYNKTCLEDDKNSFAENALVLKNDAKKEDDGDCKAQVLEKDVSLGVHKCNRTNLNMYPTGLVEEVSAVESGENCNSSNKIIENDLPCGMPSAKKLTPKQLERKAEMAKRREEIQQEKERKKKEKDRLRQEKEEEKARIRQEKEEVKKKMKEEKEKKKQAEMELKSEEKRKKENEKRKREEQKLEDKRKREELLRKKEEQEQQKKKFTKEAEAFSSFFKKYDVKAPTFREDDKPSGEIGFMPFTVKADMRLAPINRNPMDDERRSKFEELYKAQSGTDNYLAELSSGVIVPRKSPNTWPLEEKYDENLLLDEGLDLKDEVSTGPRKKIKGHRPKLLQFYENRRPPYWGTWRKKSKNIRPKNPHGKDEVFDYEVDSDDEWEEEEPGESLHGSDDEKESEDEYEVDNDFFVPHGYLSDDENPEEEIISPETQKAKLKLLGEQFDLERSEKTKLLKPITLGCFWFNSDVDEPDSVNPAIVRFLNKRKAIPWTNNIPICPLQDENIDPADAALPDSVTPTANKDSFPESGVPDLITLIHGSTLSRKNLSKIFLAQWNKKEEEKINENELNTNTIILSQARIGKKIKEIAKWEEFPEEGPYYGKFCWYVKKEVREKYGMLDLLVSQRSDDGSENKISPSLITKFTKVLTEDERRIQITKFNNRKTTPNPKPLTVSLPNSSKLNLRELKCMRKLKEFWAKPSFSAKYSLSPVVMDGIEDGIAVINPLPSKEGETVIERASETESGVTPTPRGEVTSESTGDNLVEIEEGEMAEEDHILDATAETVISSGDVSETSKISQVSGEENRDSEERQSLAESEISPEEKSHNSFECDEVSRTTPNDEKEGNTKETPSVTSSKPVVKKRVAILFSVPRGCEIVKPGSPKKSPS